MSQFVNFKPFGLYQGTAISHHLLLHAYLSISDGLHNALL